MEKTQKKEKNISWFWRWFLNNKVVTGLLIVLLILLILLVFTKVSYLFEPIWIVISTISFPFIFSGILYYLMNPVVDYLEQKNISRLWSIISLFIFVIGLVMWGIVVIIPKIQEQSMSFINHLPQYVEIIDQKVREILNDPFFNQFSNSLEEMISKLFDSLGDVIRNISTVTMKGVGNIVGAVTTFVVGIITMPFILFYLLKDGKKLPSYLMSFLPIKMRKPTANVLGEINSQVASYIRGQLTVAFAVAVMFIIGFSLIGLDYAITLGIMAGFLNLIPYLGSFLAMIPAVFLGIVGGPILLVKVLIVFIVEQTIEGRVISPLVLGSQLAIHPITILVILLSSGSMFGIIGVILGIPLYAAVKVIITHLFEWYKNISGLYEKEEIDYIDES